MVVRCVGSGTHLYPSFSHPRGKGQNEEAPAELAGALLMLVLGRYFLAVAGKTSDLMTTGTAPDVGMMLPMSM